MLMGVAIGVHYSAQEALLYPIQNPRPQLIRIPGQSPLRLEGFNFRGSQCHLGRVLGFRSLSWTLH